MKNSYLTHAPLIFCAFLLLLSTETIAQTDTYIYTVDKRGVHRTNTLTKESEYVQKVSFASAICLRVDPVEEKLYWADTRANMISRSNLDGTDLETLFHIEEAPGTCIALDINNRKIYWTNSAGLDVEDFENINIKRANMDGTDEEVIIPLGNALPWIIAIDPEENKVYWSDQRNEKLQRANLDGSGVEDIILDANASDFFIDPVDRKIYWSGFDIPFARRANLDGSEVEDVPLLLPPDSSPPSRMTFDAEERIIYWTSFFDDEIRASHIDGGAPLVIVPGKAFFQSILYWEDRLYWSNSGGFLRRQFANATQVEQLIESDFVSPYHGTWDPRDGSLYFTDYSTDKMWRSDLNGTNRTEVLPTGTEVLGSGNVVVDPESNYLYLVWNRVGEPPFWQSGIWRVRNDGSDLQSLYTGRIGNYEYLDIDTNAGKIYWTYWQTVNTIHSGFIQRSNLDGTEMEDVIEDIAYPQGISLDLQAGKVYWVERGADFPHRGFKGKIGRANLDGTNREELITDLPFPLGLDIDVNQNRMYWTDEIDGALYSSTLDGTDIQLEVDGLAVPRSVFVVDESALPVSVEDDRNNNKIDRPLSVFPNPARSYATLTLEVKEAQHTIVRIYDALGREQEVVIDRVLTEGVHQIEYNVKALAPGVYYYMVEQGQEARVVSFVVG